MSRPFVVLLVVLVGCTSALPEPSRGPTGRSGSLVGMVRYEARSPTFRGASSAISLRPARHVPIAAIDASGAVLAESITDDQGVFRLDPSAPTVAVRVRATIRTDGYAIDVSPDALGRQVHTFDVVVPATGALDVIARDDAPGGPGGAFHILDTLYRGERAVRDMIDASLPPLYVFWGRGVTDEWSFYVGEAPEGSGRFRLELLGGVRDRRSTTDTDEHDEAVVLHELGHFVFDRLSSASSAGGPHPSGHYVDPGLAWEEGRATWFAAIVLGRSQYTDTIGLEPTGRLQVHSDLEHRSPPPRGLGSQETVEEVLWDLVDGSASIPEDFDRDGAAVEPAILFGAMVSMSRDASILPCFPTYLRYLVDHDIVSEATMRGVLRAGSLPEALLPDNGHSPWPDVLAIDVEQRGEVDTITDPAPSGGPRFPRTGFDAVRTYLVTIPADGTLEVRLSIDGRGDESDRTDLDLELRDLRSDELASSRGTTREETLDHEVRAGSYVIRVVDGGADGARARYRLRARLTRR